MKTGLIVMAGLALTACHLLPDECSNIACGACAPPLSITVQSPAGTAVSGVTLSGIAGDCGESQDATHCSVYESGPGTYEFDITAPGYQTHHVKETIAAVEARGCCSCGYEPKTISVTLQPE